MQSANAPDICLPTTTRRLLEIDAALVGSHDRARLRRRNRRRLQAGQSAIIAVIVLFLLLFLGAAFIALIANNLRNTQRAATTSESGRYAEAGIRYLDQQLMNSPQGADWRPAPDNESAANYQDPDYFYLQPYHYDTGRQIYVGGYTRVNFGGPQPSTTSAGGRALVRILYTPDIYDKNGTAVPNDPNPGQVQKDPNWRIDPSHKYFKLDSVGRSGQIDPLDPTTFGSSNAIGQRVELTAYKQIGLNEYVRQVTNKDNKPDDFALGSVYPVQDYDANGNIVSRNVETLIDGPIRINGNVTFYGVDRLLLNPNRNDALEVAGKIGLNGVDASSGLTANDPTRVFVNTSATTTTGNLYPSDSPNFTTNYNDLSNNSAPLVPGIVRDNPRGSDTLGIPGAGTDANLRSVPHSQPPLMDLPIGPNGLTRYLALTRDSVPLSAAEVADNPLAAALTASGPNGVSTAGAVGWGVGLYINNPVESQNPGPTSSLRGEWLNPPAPGTTSTNWTADYKYLPPAVDILLTPRYMVLTSTSGSNYFHAPAATIKLKGGTTASGFTPGQVLPQQRIVVYTDTGAPTSADIPDGTPEIEGYHAIAPGGSHPNSYVSDNIVYAEGNVSIRGAAGGLDPDTLKYYQRHLTIVSNGTIYVNGNLLRDNVASSDSSSGANEVRGSSSIALLAKQYVTVNTTQFLSPDVTTNAIPEIEGGTFPVAFDLGPTLGHNLFGIHVNLGPEDRDNTLPLYVTSVSGGGSTLPPFQIFFRHASANSNTSATKAGIRLAINPTPAALPYYYTFPPGYGYLLDPMSLSLETADQGRPGFNDDVFALQPADIGKLRLTGAAPAIATDNLLQIQYQTDPAISTHDYLVSRVGVAPLDIRIEAMMYAQEGSLFIIPGPWFNPDANDTLVNYLGNGNDPTNQKGRRAGENPNPNPGGSLNITRTSAYFPFYGTPLDARITFYGAISENTTAEIGDQGAWLAKWGWVPNYLGSSGLTGVARPANFPSLPAKVAGAHGPYGYLQLPDPTYEPAAFKTGVTPDGVTGGSGIVYQFDARAVSPYVFVTNGGYRAIRTDSYGNILPLVPNLPVAPGLLYFGENTNVPQ